MSDNGGFVVASRGCVRNTETATSDIGRLHGGHRRRRVSLHENYHFHFGNCFLHTPKLQAALLDPPSTLY